MEENKLLKAFDNGIKNAEKEFEKARIKEDYSRMAILQSYISGLNVGKNMAEFYIKVNKK